MKKSTKRFTISTEAKNSLGFRVRTGGIDLADFKTNPLLLWMHKRPKGERADEILPIGYWDDIQLKDGKITGVPVFDDSDDFALKIYNKVENGTIKMASAGLKPVQFAETEGEKWLEKSSLQEGSLVDIGSNKEALSVALYNEDNELIKLADFEKTHGRADQPVKAHGRASQQDKPNTMKLIELSADSVFPLLKLKEEANAAEAHAAILNLVTLAETQKTEIETLKGEKAAIELKLTEAENAGKQSEIVNLVEKAIEDRKITADQKDTMVKLAEADFDTAKSYLDGLKASPEVNAQINTGDGKDASLVKLSWKELEDKGKLIQLKEQDIEAFKEKFKEEFNADYKAP